MNKIALVFPGQGSQSVGMGKDLSSSVYLLADNIFAKFHANNSSIEPKSISEVSFNGPEEKLTRTIYTQPAILTLSLALFEELKKQIDLARVAYVAGHSLGEFSALYAAGVLSLEDTIRLVVKRADLMERAPSGAMSAIVGLDDTTLNPIIESVTDASVANYNAPDQIVATGTKEAMIILGQQIEEFTAANNLKARVIPLTVGGAFHSPLMQEAATEFSAEIDKCNFKDALIPIIQNTSASPVSKADEIKTNLKKQMTGSVRWTETVKYLLSSGVEVVYEVGPGKVLAGLIKKQERRFPVENISSKEDLEKICVEAG